MNDSNGNNAVSIAFMLILALIAVAYFLFTGNNRSQADAGAAMEEPGTSSPSNGDSSPDAGEEGPTAAVATAESTTPTLTTLPDPESLEQRVQQFEQLFYSRPLGLEEDSFKQSLLPLVTTGSGEAVEQLNPLDAVQQADTRLEAKVDVTDVTLDATSTADQPVATVTVSVRIIEITSENTAQDIDRTSATRRWHYIDDAWYVQLGEGGYNH